MRVGDEVRAIDGGGRRIRRQGVRRLTAFPGHLWQSTVFPSGRAFGLLVYPPRPDGKPTYSEAFLFDGDGDLIPARVVEGSWLRDLAPGGQDVSVLLQAEDGRTAAIHGETILSTCHVMGPHIPDYAAQAGADAPTFRLQQAIARYTWDGESGNGMLERSSAVFRAT